MKNETWSAALVPAGGLIRLGWFMQGLAVLAVGLCGVAMNWPVLASMGMAGATAAMLVLWGAARPAVWAASGQLHLADGFGRWQDATGSVFEGSVRWLWLGRALVGLELMDGSGQKKAFWLTAERTGEVAWWQLQRWLRLVGSQASPR